MTNFGWKTARWPLLTFVATLLLGACQSGPTATDHLQHAERALADGRLGQARSHVEHAERKGSSERSVSVLRADLERRIAEQALDNDHTEKAYRHFKRAAELDPRRVNRADSYLQAARLADRMDRSPAHVAELADQAVEANPALAEARRLAGQMWDEAGRYDRAIPAYLWLWQADHSRLDVGRRLANLYQRRGRPDDALAILQQLREANPDNPRVVLKIANLYADTDRPARARDLFEQIVDEHPDQPGFLLQYARFLESRGETERARKVKRKAYDKMPGVERREMRELQ
jgi:tetratricopeptide (TPR) repeat protein